MKIRTIEDLTAPGDAVRRFTPEGLSTTHQMTPESSARFIQSMVADSDLAPEIPEHVREHFERCRTLHTYGIFKEAYGFFTVASQLAFFTLETALGAAFMRDFPAGVPLARPKTGETRTIHTDTFAEVFEALHKGWRVQGDPQLESTEFRWKEFKGSMRSLLAWARAKGLFYGERNSVIEEAMLQLRHLGAHPHSLLILTPVESAQAIRDMAELINHLWDIPLLEAVYTGKRTTTEKSRRLPLNTTDDIRETSVELALELAEVPCGQPPPFLFAYSSRALDDLQLIQAVFCPKSRSSNRRTACACIPGNT